MKVEIKNRFDGSVIFTIKTTSWRLAVEAAVKSKTNLRYADLRYANLRSADLRYANLRYANLSSADLSYADLSYADLRSANLSYANLSSANLSYANLRYANLRYAKLSSADLSYANLSYANLRSADLSYADLSYAEGINKFRCTPLTILLDQTGKIRAYKLVTEKNEGPFNGGIIYEKGESYSVDNADCSDEQCAAGISLATLDWCMMNYEAGFKILIVEFTAKDIASIPIATDGKFRVHRCKVVGEKDLKEIGLIV
jgi:uncharacterized protein YjbI with pentapeptide repeats